MSNNRVLLLLPSVIALLLLLHFPVPASAQASGPPKRETTYVFVLGSSDMPVVGAALHLVISALQTKRKVHILLLADGLNLSRKGATGPQFPAYKADGPTMLKQAMDAGADVAVCQICLRNQNIGIDAMIEGVSQVNAFQLLDLTDAADVVLSFGSASVQSQVMPAMPPAGSGAVPVPGKKEECDPATDRDGCM